MDEKNKPYGLKEKLKDFMLIEGFKLKKETKYKLIFINGGRKITINLTYN